MDSVTRRVATYVKDKGISVAALSEGTGISYGCLWPSIAGKRQLRGSEFLQICDFLEKNPLYFSDKNNGGDTPCP